MKKIYSLSFLILLITSCAPRIKYLGNSYAPTSQVDVFVSEDAIKKNYDIVGKGYVQHGGLYKKKIEKIQSKAVEKAKQRGVDGVLIQEYYVPNTGTSISSVSRSDSLFKGLITIGNTQIQSTGSGGFTIQFLKYSQK
jgi:hypothetical protein